MDYKKIISLILIGFMVLPILAVPIFAMDYTVQPGDTLYLLGKKHNTNVSEIKNVNSLQGDKLQVGQKLNIPTNGGSNLANFTQEEMDLLARAVYSEARGESYSGQVAVAAVILNRLAHPDFPNTVKDIIFQPWAFTAVHDGQFWLTPDAQAYKAVRDAINGWDPTGNAIYYWNPVTATSKWIWSRQIHTQIGKHVFAH